MNRQELIHAIRASCDLLRINEVVVVGSQAILGQYADAPREMRSSPEADIWAEGLAQEEIDRLNAIGFGSQFHITHGFYIDPVSPTTAVMPKDWRDRAVTVNVPGKECAGICPEAGDLAISKLARSDEKDINFVAAMLYHRMGDERTIRQRILELDTIGDLLREAMLSSLQIAHRKALARRKQNA